MDNTKAGLAAVETGSLRRRDVLTDVFLGTVWTEAAGAMRDLARLADPSFAATAQRRGQEGARVDQPPVPRRRKPADQLRDHEGRQGPGRADGLAGLRHLARRVRPRATGCRGDARPVGARGARHRLGRPHALEGEHALRAAVVQQRRLVAVPDRLGRAGALQGRARRAAWQYLDALADLTFLEGRGYMPELLSGDLLRTVDAAVPISCSPRPASFRPSCGGWSACRKRTTACACRRNCRLGGIFLRVRNLKWREARGTLEVRRGAASLAAR